jgi:hypothetical protein
MNVKLMATSTSDVILESVAISHSGVSEDVMIVNVVLLLFLLLRGSSDFPRLRVFNTVAHENNLQVAL